MSTRYVTDAERANMARRTLGHWDGTEIRTDVDTMNRYNDTIAALLDAGDYFHSLIGHAPLRNVQGCAWCKVTTQIRG